MKEADSCEEEEDVGFLKDANYYFPFE